MFPIASLTPKDDVEPRLEDEHRLWALIDELGHPDDLDEDWRIARELIARAAQELQGLDPNLEDRSAARLLRDGDLDVVGPEVMSAARAWLVGA